MSGNAPACCATVARAAAAARSRSRACASRSPSWCRRRPTRRRPPGEPPELDRQERALINNILRLRETTADDVMIPRADIIAIRADVTLEQAIEQIRREGHSRLPVYREQLDDIIGMIHVKDLFAYVGRPEAFSIEAILRRPLMVAPQIPVLDLLLQMRQAHMHLALVVDEYGGIDGLVTIEDLVETITGDISDEHDEVASRRW